MSDLELTRPGRAVSLAQAIRSHAALLSGFLGVMWIVQILEFLPFLHLQNWGIHPRTVVGLLGILLAPFLHAGFAHLMANSVPFFLLGGIVLLGGRGVFWRVTLFVVLFGGLAVWLFAGSYTNHIGASGLIFGYLGFLLARGVVERSAIWILIAAVTFFGYGSLLYGVLPMQPGVSWQSHLFGFLAGISAAKLMFGGTERKLLR